MRIMFNVSAVVVVGVCATWAYRVNYETQEAANRVSELRRQIAEAREGLAMEQAEWAYLNRPDRLRALVEANPRLGLAALAPEQFVDVSMIAFPPDPAAQLDAEGPRPRGPRPRDPHPRDPRPRGGTPGLSGAAE